MAALMMKVRETFIPNVTIIVNVTICMSLSLRTVEVDSFLPLSSFVFLTIIESTKNIHCGLY